VAYLEGTVSFRYRGGTLVTWYRCAPLARALVVVEPGATHDYLLPLIEGWPGGAAAHDPVGNGRSLRTPRILPLIGPVLAARELACLLEELATVETLVAHGGAALHTRLAQALLPARNLTTVLVAPRLWPPDAAHDPFAPRGEPLKPHERATLGWIAANPEPLGAWRTRGLAVARRLAPRLLDCSPGPAVAVCEAGDWDAMHTAAALGATVHEVPAGIDLARAPRLEAVVAHAR